MVWMCSWGLVPHLKYVVIPFGNYCQLPYWQICLPQHFPHKTVKNYQLGSRHLHLKDCYFFPFFCGIEKNIHWRELKISSNSSCWMLWYSKGWSSNILYIFFRILYWTLLWIYSSFIIFDDDNEEACDTAVTWHVTWCDVIKPRMD